MNDQQDGPRQGDFDEIRILGLDGPEDAAEPGRSVFGAEPATGELPHWSEPPVDVSGGTDDGDLWSGLEDGPRWSDDVPDDHESQQPVGDEDAAAVFFDDGPLGSTSNVEFDPPLLPPDEPLPDPVPGLATGETAPAAPGANQPVAPAPPGPTTPRVGRSAGADRNMPIAIVTGVGLGALALVAFKVGANATLALTTILLVVAAAEFFLALRRAGYQPASLLGVTAGAALNLASYWRFEAAVPLVLGLTVLFTMLWYLTGVDRQAPLLNASVTLLGVLYVGFLGSFVGLMLTDPNGIGMLLAAVLCTVAYDTGGLVVGRMAGRSPLSAVSPNKTMEGLVGGMAVCFAMAVLVVGRITPFGQDPGDLSSAFVLGVVAALAAPLGDLCESMVKRDLGIKDMGSILPGHGGLMDRFDALLFVLPATYYAARLMDLFTV
ncbi:MAG: phosphatidate cytidylyltransferase [Actinomycetota bacterium]|nr:phosphatidate cytidylyltransferase [Actinomycetota bacterium]